MRLMANRNSTHVSGKMKPASWSQVRVNPDESAEIMHGVGHTTKATREDGKEVDVSGKCAAAVHYATTQKRAWSRPDVYTELEETFGEAAGELTVTDFADGFYAATCHGMALPCSEDGDSCVNQGLAQTVLGLADKYYCARFAGSDGGLTGTRLSLYPFVKEVLDRLGTTKLALYSGHDTVIAPVLASLGLFKGPLCRWPGYAAHIVFEMYEKAASGDISDSGASNAPPARYIRVLFNGAPMKGAAGCPTDTEYCKLETFAEGVTGLLNGAASIEDACAL